MLLGIADVIGWALSRLVWGLSLSIVTLFFCAASHLSAQETLALSSGTAAAGGSATLSLTLTSPAGSEPAGVQWTLSYSPAAIVSIAAAAGASATSAGKSLTCATTSGSYTCLLAGMNAIAMQNGVVAVVSVTIAAGVASAAINVTNSSGADPGGNSLTTGGVGGIVTHASPPPTTLSALSCAPASLSAGGSSTCTASLSAPAPPAGAAVALASNAAALTVQSSVTVAAGSTSATFTTTAGSITSAQTATVTATLNGGTQTAAIALLAQVVLSGLSCTPASLESGGRSTCSATVSNTAGATVALSSNVAALTVPASVSVAAGSTAGSFAVTTASIASNQAATITATLNGSTVTATIALSAATVVSALSCVPASLTSTATSECVVLVSNTGGATVTLSSSAAALTVPASVTVGPGSTTATFTATAGSVASAQTATITAALNGSTQTAVITLLAPCSYALAFGGEAFPVAGGSGSVGVLAPGECSWTAVSTVSWVTVTGGASGTGNGTVAYRVAANAGGAQSGSLTIAGLPFAIKQASATVTGLVFAGSMAQLASGGLWNTTITLVNTGTTAAEAVLNFFDDSGSALLLPLTFPQTSSTAPLLASILDETINAGAELVIQTAGMAGQTTQEGWAQLMANGKIGGSSVFAFATATGAQEAVVPLETRNPAAFVLPFDYTGGYATGVSLANLSSHAVSVPVILRDDTGASLGAAPAVSLPAYGHTSFMLATNYPAVAGRLGALELDTPPGGQMSALGIRAAPDDAITTVPVLATAAVSDGSMAQLASGGLWNTTITLVNTGTEAAQVSLNFYDDNGNALLLPLIFPQTSSTTPQPVATLNQTIGAQAQLVIQTAGTAGQTTTEGWAQLSATGGNVGGTAVFAWTTATGPQEAVAPVETLNPAALVLPFDYTGGYATGVALANLSSQEAIVPVALRDDKGAPLGTAVIFLPAYAHTSFMLAASYPAVAGHLGTIELDTPEGGQIGALGIRATPSGAITSVPALAK